MADEQTQDGPAAQPTSEERLRALTGDRKRKVHGKAKPAPGPATTRPGDLVDAVRERSRDTGRDQPL
jgi:uncharacterized protein YjbJ (UPF0337 family)